jgi:hypothetical protein
MFFIWLLHSTTIFSYTVLTNGSTFFSLRSMKWIFISTINLFEPLKPVITILLASDFYRQLMFFWTFGLKGKEVAGEWVKLWKKVINNLCSPNISARLI